MPHTLSLDVVETNRASVFDQIRESSGQLHGLLLSVSPTKSIPGVTFLAIHYLSMYLKSAFAGHILAVV